MADSFNFELVSPERLLLSGSVTQVVIPASEGEMTIMANHSPVMSTIKPGVVSVMMSDGKAERFVVFGGFVEILPSMCILLAESAVPVEKIDRNDLAQQLQDAREDVADAETDSEKRKAQDYLDHLTTLEAAL